MLLITLPVVVDGCYQSIETGEETSGRKARIGAEAYLFDARMKRDGKPTSVRLDLYQTDTLIAFNGRGYLGKGAFKGWLTSDSLKAYFPSTNEYVYEAVDDLFASLNCTTSTVGLPLFRCFHGTPGTGLPKDLLVQETDPDPGRHVFVIQSAVCPWTAELVYDRQVFGERLERFSFDDGSAFTVKSKRRQYKAEAKVPNTRFRLNIPADAVRVIP